MDVASRWWESAAKADATADRILWICSAAGELTRPRAARASRSSACSCGRGALRFRCSARISQSVACSCYLLEPLRRELRLGARLRAHGLVVEDGDGSVLERQGRGHVDAEGARDGLEAAAVLRELEAVPVRERGACKLPAVSWCTRTYVSYFTSEALSLMTACLRQVLRSDMTWHMSAASTLRPRSAAWRRVSRSLTAMGRPQEHSSTTR